MSKIKIKVLLCIFIFNGPLLISYQNFAEKKIIFDIA